MALTASSTSSVHTGAMETVTVSYSDPIALIAAALKFNKLSIDEGFAAFDQVICRTIFYGICISL